MALRYLRRYGSRIILQITGITRIVRAVYLLSRPEISSQPLTMGTSSSARSELQTSCEAHFNLYYLITCEREKKSCLKQNRQMQINLF